MATGAIIFEDRLRIPADVFELNKFRNWAHSDDFPERGRISFIAGQIEVDMSPEEIHTHNLLKAALAVDLGNWVRQHKLGHLLADGAMLVNEAAGLATEPDLMFCSWESLRSGTVRYGEWAEGSGRAVEVLGSPDMVVEIVSRYSVRKDTRVLRQSYFTAGITEYWLIDARGEEIDFQLLRRGEAKFVAVESGPDGFRHSDVLGGSFRLTRQRDPVGSFEYSLLAH
jgi:Uma2 family endonuclease